MPEARKPNAKQLEAIETTEGPVLITAGPGTGKTYTLVQRAMYLMQEKGVKPENILIATFTEKAAKELITRITNEARERGLKCNIGEMYIGTFHSICGKLLKEYLDSASDMVLRRNYRMMDEFEQKYLIFKNIEKFKEIDGIEKYTPPVKAENYDPAKEAEYNWRDAKKICSYVGKFKEELITPQELINQEGLTDDEKDPGIVTMGRIMEEYEKLLGNDRIDYAGLQVKCYKLLSENSDILKKVQKQIHYIMIDEYQDTNYIQEQLVLLLGVKQDDKENHNDNDDNNDKDKEKDRNICVVGDDDQALYRFRNATVRNILEFQELPEIKAVGCPQVKLEINHRSNKKIIDFYNKWMHTTESNEPGKEFSFSWEQEDEEQGKKKFRHDKTIVPKQDSDKNNDFEAVLKLDGKTQEEWRQRVLDFLKNLKNSGRLTDYNQCAFLFFSVKAPPVLKLAEFLEENGVPVYSPRSKMFFKRREIMLALGCFLHLFPKYKKYREAAGQEKVPEFYAYYNKCFDMLNEPEYRELQETLKGINPAEFGYTALLYRLFGSKPFRDYLDTEIRADVLELRPARNLASLTGIIAKYEAMNDIKVTDDETAENLLDEYIKLLYGSGIDEYEDAAEYAPKGCVSFMTVHQAKGMEFPVVFVDSISRNAADLKAKPKEPTEADRLEWKIRKHYYKKKEYEPPKLKKYFDFWRFYYTAFSRAQDLLVLTCYENDIKILKSGKEKFIPKAPSAFFLPVYKDLESRTEPDKRIKFEETKKAEMKDRFSFTGHIAVYDSCPLQYKFNKELGFKSARYGNMVHTEFGTLVHETIEDVHREVLRALEQKTVPEITEEKIADWLIGNYNALVESGEHVDIPEDKQAEALQHVLRYVARLKGKWGTIKHAEADVILDAKDYIIEGKIDLVKGDGDTVEIVDFKTAEEKPKEGDFHYNRYKKQLELYAFLVQARYGYKVSRMHLHYTSEENDPLITFEYTGQDVQETMDAFDKTARKILTKDFSGQVSTPMLCKKCDFRFYCRKDTAYK